MGLLQITAKLVEYPGEQLLAPRVVNELGLESSQDRDVLLDREVELRKLGVERSEGLGGQLPREAAEFERAPGRRVDEQLPIVETPAAGLVGHLRIEEDRVHNVAFPSSLIHSASSWGEAEFIQATAAFRGAPMALPG